MFAGQKKSVDDKLEEAFKALEDRARETNQDIRELFSNRYAGLEDQISEFNDQIKDSMRHTAERIAGVAARTEKFAEKKAKEVGEKVNKEVHYRPWPYVGSAAVCGLVLGSLLTASRRKNQ